MDISVELFSKTYGKHVMEVTFPTHVMLIDRNAIETEDGRALLALSTEVHSLQAQLASAQAEKAELVKQAAEIADDKGYLSYADFSKKYGCDTAYVAILALLPKG